MLGLMQQNQGDIPMAEEAGAMSGGVEGAPAARRKWVSPTVIVASDVATGTLFPGGSPYQPDAPGTPGKASYDS